MTIICATYIQDNKSCAVNSVQDDDTEGQPPDHVSRLCETWSRDVRTKYAAMGTN